jgi:hypothetical protein
MHIRDLALVVAATAAACAINPDSRGRTLERVVADGRGGWIVVQLTSGAEASGELIAADGDSIRVLTSVGLLVVPPREVVSARLWAWETELSGVIAWGTIGTVSTISHGFFLIFTAPIWVGATSLITALESRKPIVDYPEQGLSELARWARFPQGMPRTVQPGDLIDQARAPVGSAPAGHGPPGTTGAPGPGSGSAAGSGAGSDSLP